jgi:hypothetical protein
MYLTLYKLSLPELSALIEVDLNLVPFLSTLGSGNALPACVEVVDLARFIKSISDLRSAILIGFDASSTLPKCACFAGK